MALSSSDIAVSSSQYQGNPGLGGGTFGFVQLDLKPLEDLAKYTMLYNKSQYDQRQKDAEKISAEIADYTSFDLTSGIEKDREHLDKKYRETISWINANPDARNYRNKELYQQYKQRINDLDNDIRGGKIRTTMNELRLEQISAIKDPELKAFYEKELSDEIGKTDIRTPLKHAHEFDLTPIKISAAPIKKVQVTEIGRNVIGQAEFKLPDMDAVANMAIALGSGLSDLSEFENQEWFQSKPENEKDLIRKQYRAQLASGKLEPVETSNHINAAIAKIADQKNADGTFKYRDANGRLDVAKLLESGDTLITRTIQQMDIYNKNMDKMVGAIDNRYFIDDFGNELHFGTDASGLKKSSYSKIDIEGGISPEELLKMRILAASPATERDIKIDQTDLKLKEGQLGVAWFNATTGRMNANRLASGGETALKPGVQTPAILFGQHIERVKNAIAQRNGDFSVSFDATDVSTKKALGIKEDDPTKGLYIRYGKDGTIRVGADVNGRGGTPVTMDQLKQGYMDVVKAGLSEEGVQAEGFLESAEKEFNAIWGTRSGKVIWDKWGNVTTPAPATTTLTPEQKAFNLKYFGNENGPVKQ